MRSKSGKRRSGRFARRSGHPRRVSTVRLTTTRSLSSTSRSRKPMTMPKVKDRILRAGVLPVGAHRKAALYSIASSGDLSNPYRYNISTGVLWSSLRTPSFSRVPTGNYFNGCNPLTKHPSGFRRPPRHPGITVHLLSVLQTRHPGAREVEGNDSGPGDRSVPVKPDRTQRAAKRPARLRPARWQGQQTLP